MTETRPAELSHVTKRYGTTCALDAVGSGQGAPACQRTAVLACYTILFVGLAVAGYTRDDGRTYG